MTLIDKLSGDSDFQDAARLTFAAAGELYGKSSLEQQAVRTGWAEVGIEIKDDEDDEGSSVNGNSADTSGCLHSFLSLKAVRWLRAK